ncbi:hypothetical protein SEA_CHOCOLAT_13 [Arthrobacter phage Chocolat]|uniref:Uncharacterized protein n=9 Tax=Klausavirus princesstrina TaxID=1984784 RepID=A0A286N426_9CAUD|nr:hypothetical protein SEA_CONBOY_13 [Arthrobacter phage Conboy]AOZ64678.1 hypothetical protein SEA_CHOCOLAT_13 [Arthrobacter phage Chocolat]APC44697.1 hypothetical protein SEA_EDGARPOE_13 [Arthrobacter phage EdgarPoe]APC44808.1 hypothetical protein SEA_HUMPTYDUMPTY_13 [Arthrobacter phage HumptyDumpty]ASX98798.1 hypothetical protein SEA_KABREEZE_13 [Arthrobacter phage Kabreeze]ASX99021.1 hypothetical protein SEA_SCAVITO_13 [Arthrobacter phage Scavito]ASX99133.1 hypothetical protein SEA_TOPHA
MTTAAQKRRSASDALKGTATPAEETLPLSEATGDAAKTEETPATGDQPAETKADATVDAPAADPAEGADVDADAEDDDDAEEDELVEAVVLFDLFNYFDESDAHCSALKGVTVHVDHETAKRGVKLGALKVKG